MNLDEYHPGHKPPHEIESDCCQRNLRRRGREAAMAMAMAEHVAAAPSALAASTLGTNLKVGSVFVLFLSIPVFSGAFLRFLECFLDRIGANSLRHGTFGSSFFVGGADLNAFLLHC